MGVSKKRMNQIKLLAMNRKGLNRRIQKTRKPEKLQVRTNQFTKIFKALITRKEVPLKCWHYMIGSSCFLRFLKNQFTIKKAHRCLHMSLNHKVESIGEQAFAKKI